MGAGIYTATAGAVAQQTRLDIVSNNLANTDTTGFRQMAVGFEGVLTEEISPTNKFVGVQKGRLSTTPGPIIETGNPLDLAVDGPGFLAVQAPAGGTMLMKSGSFVVTSEGAVVSPAGLALSGADGPIRVDPSLPVTVDRDGRIVQGKGPVGAVRIIGVADPAALEPAGLGSYLPTTASGLPFEVKGQVVSGALEGSNVQPVESMVQMIQLQRDFGSLLRVINSYKEADDQLLRVMNR